MRKRSSYLVGAAGLSVLLSIASIGPTHASDDMGNASAAEVATTIAERELTGGKQGGGRAVDIDVDVDQQSVEIADSEISMTVPGEPSAEQVDVGAVPEGLFDGESAPILTTAQEEARLSSFETDDGVQTIIQIESAEASREYRFPLGLPAGGEAVLFDDGSVALVDETGTAVGGFRAPWAIDAHGDPVPTRFRVEGDELIQTIDFDAQTAFPVTADPYLGVQWWGYYVQLTRTETKRAAGAIANNQGVGVLAGVACGAFGGPASIACGTAIALAYFRIADPIARANSAGRCAAINYPWLALSAPHVGWSSINVTTVTCRG